MPFIQGSVIEKAKKNSIENRLDTVKHLVQSKYDSPLNIVATFEDYVLAFDKDKGLRKISYYINEDGVLEIKSNNASKAIPVIEDDNIPFHVAGELTKITNLLMNGNGITEAIRTQVRELIPFVRKDEMYWMSDIVSSINEATGEDSEWYKMYDANVERIRTSLHGRIRDIEGQVPKTHYSRLAENRLLEFKKEISDSINIINELYSGFIVKCQGFTFSEKQEFLSAVRESLIAESQAIVGLLGKADKLSGQDGDLPLVAKAHDRLADRARTMALVSEYIGMKAQSNDKE
jgi:hypothetical protein